MGIPTSYKKEITDALKDAVTAGTLKAVLLKASTYLAFDATDAVYADVSAHACVGQPAGGFTLATGTSTASGVDYIFDADEINSGTGTSISDIGWVCIYDTGDGNAIKCIKQVSPTASVSSGTLIIQWSATNGIIKVTSA